MKKIKIQVLGSGCQNCQALYNKVLKVVKEIDSNLEVEYITNITKMLELGAMSSPVFAVDKRIITAGRMLNEQEIKEAILEKLN